MANSFSDRYFNPQKYIKSDYKAVYGDGKSDISKSLVRPNTTLILGAEFGDEGRDVLLIIKLSIC
ncbi:MAG: hypothetical protein Fur003_0110 [Candidatus Dojkabacteria bacterium]